MAYFFSITNPFVPTRGMKVVQHPGGITVLGWLNSITPGGVFKQFDRPTICQVNGKVIMQKDWETRVVKDDDRVAFVAVPGDPITVLYVVVALLVVATVVLAISIKTPKIVTGQTPEADPVYSLKGQRNQIRLNQPIESAYGRTRMWPSIAAAEYSEYESNQQWRYQLFSLGHGSFEIESMAFEDTPIGNFADVIWQVIEPGQPVTLFPDNVVTSVEVANLELFGPNEPEANGVWVVDSPGDPELGIPESGHYGFSSATAFVVNPAFTETNLIKLDVALPRGLYIKNNASGLDSLTVTALFEAQQIDDAGTPVGAWFTIASFSRTLATVTPQRYTLTCEVPSGRYQVRGHRTSDKNTSEYAGNTLIWEAMRAFLPSDRTYPGKTLIAVKARASNNLNDNTANRFNCVATRKLPVWDGSRMTDEDPVATRAIIYAYIDVFRSKYGGNLSTSFINIPALLALDATYTARGEYFDWIFDQAITVWDAAKIIATVGRAVPMLDGSRITMIRDEAKTLPTAVFNQENMVENSFKHDVKFHGIDAKDGLEVEYTNPTTWKQETVLCLYDGDAGTNVQNIKLNGCTSRQHAYNWGRWRRACIRLQREVVSFATGLEGHVSTFGDLIAVASPVFKTGKGGFVTAVDGTILTLSEPVTFDPAGCKILLQKKTGQSTGLLTVTAGDDPYHVVLAAPLTESDFSWDPEGEPPRYIFGPTVDVTRYCKVTGLAPGDDETVGVTGIPYRPEIYLQDGTPPPGGDGSGNLPNTPGTPSIRGLLVVPSPNVANEVIATWQATRGAKYYIVELSYDGVVYERVADFVEDTNVRFTVVPRVKMYVRAAAVVAGQGGWAYWVGTAPVDVAVNTYVSYIFRRAPYPGPATPTGDSPADWFDAPPAADGNPLWMSLATFDSVTDEKLTDWSTPVSMEGGSITVEYSVNGSTGWHSTFTLGDIYMRQKVGDGDWSDAIRIVGEKGDKGDPGDAGPPGSATIYSLVISTPWNGVGYVVPTVDGMGGSNDGFGNWTFAGLSAGDYHNIDVPATDGPLTFGSWGGPSAIFVVNTGLNSTAVMLSGNLQLIANY